MKIIFLGTGTSTGVPEIGCQCEVCTSKDHRDWRLRTSAVIETEGKRLLIDCGPDFRWQVIKNRIYQLDGVLITHEHYDHVGGLDDLRPFCRYGEVNVYAEENVAYAIKTRIPYVFAPNKYPGVPNIRLNVIKPHQLLHIGGIDVMPVQVMHDKLPILGYRLGDLMYITDMKTIGDNELEYFHGVKVLVVNALRFTPEHHSHLTVGQAVAFAKKVGAEHTFFTHMGHDIGLHDEVNKMLPNGIKLAYDGQIIDF